MEGIECVSSIPWLQWQIPEGVSMKLWPFKDLTLLSIERDIEFQQDQEF